MDFGALDAVIQRTRRARDLEWALRHAMMALAYEEIAVPLLEADDGGGDWGAAYRVLDGQGAVLALRPDMTAPVARLCALGDRGGPRPRRLCYIGNLFRRAADGTPRELWQAGAERIGPGPDGDVEVLSLAIHCLERAGITRFRLAVGHVGYLQEFLREGGCRAATVEAAEAALRRRDFVTAGHVLQRHPQVFDAVRWRGSVPEAQSRSLSANGPQGRAFRALLSACSAAGIAEHLVVEPGLVLPGRYYTGLVFEVSVAGSAPPVGDGGRYDGLLRRWGASEPAVGFALDCDGLLDAVPEVEDR